MANSDLEKKLASDQALPIYLLDDVSWDINFSSEMSNFGYQIKKFRDVELFSEQLKKQHPAILIININLVNNQLQNILIDINEKSIDSKNIIIFISTSGELSLRLKAVRLGGEGYFIKPFLTENLIARIDHLLKSAIDPNRILIINNEIEAASYYAAILEQANMKVCIITKSNEVDRALHEFNPDLILIDFIMPDCNGLELAKIIRQQSIFQSISILFITSEEEKLKQLNKMRLGIDDFVTKSTQPIYFIMMIRNRIERYKKLRSLIVSDDLTGVYNHSFIQNQLEMKLKESRRDHSPLSIALIDLDQFKNINDSYGHQAGDQVLRCLGLMLGKWLHASDIAGRYSAEKFLVILPNTAPEAAKSVIDRLRKQFLMINYSWKEEMFNAFFSAGIASFPRFHTSAELISAAEKAMLRAKQLGRNRVELAT
jgi:diguanylate cyclase (GGDEF)-like protein